MRVSNARLKDAGQGLVGVFVGGSNGIGETTAREFARQTLSPRIYIIGRNEERAAGVAAELRSLNPSSFVHHIVGDLTLLKNVDEICAKILTKENKVNVLCLSAGFLSTQGRDETSEGLDKKLAIHYYSRWRFVMNLLHPLQVAAGNGEFAKVLSILSAGKEGGLILNDLGLREENNYTLRRVRAHAATMNSLTVEHLAAKYPNIAFLHAFPGWVHTNVFQGLGFFLGTLMNLAFIVLRPWVTPIRESGERNLFAATSEVYTAGNVKNSSSALGSDDCGASGGYLLDWDSKPTGNRALLKQYRKEGVDEVVWKHTIETFERISLSHTLLLPNPLLTQDVNQRPPHHWHIRLRLYNTQEFTTQQSDSSEELQTAITSAKSLHEATDAVCKTLVRKLAKAMMMESENVDPDRPADAYSVDSLVAVEIRTRVYKEVKSDVSVFNILQRAVEVVIIKNCAELAAFVTGIKERERALDHAVG
ncbi:MAG: hypothetical protein Q9227_002820 [Pyrenula ochraceoflavens]